jgi:uncharacterized protein GlcG (DUF336 family)
MASKAFMRCRFVLDISVDDESHPNGLMEEDPSTSLEPMTSDKVRLLSRAGDVGEDARSSSISAGPALVLFRSALADTTAENEAWLDRKARTVLRYETSTTLLAARFEAQGVDPGSAGWFDTKQFWAAGGPFPVRVRGFGVVAAITVSGLTSEVDDDIVIQRLTQYVDMQTHLDPQT